MESHEKKEKQEIFIEFRVLHGMSFDKISKELGVSKPTLISWAKEFELQIKKLKNEVHQELMNSYMVMIKKRFSELQKVSSKATELLSDTSALEGCRGPELLKIIIECHKELNKIEEKLTGDNKNRNSPLPSFLNVY